jgi:hypothetical protein
MAINPLQYSGVVAPRDLDFSSLAQLPQQYRQGQARQTLANLQRGPDGQIDTAPLYASGDLSLANLAKEIDRNKSIEGRDARDFQFRQQQAQLGQRNADRSYQLQERSLNRREIPSGFEQNPAGGLRPITGGPADPTYKRTTGDRQNAPAGYLWNDPNDPSKGLTAIPGGPGEKISAEVAARIGLAKSFIGQLDDYTDAEGKPQTGLRARIKAGEATGLVDGVMGAANIGESASIRRKVSSGAEALLRNLTGAGMNIDEAKKYVARYEPQWNDSASTLLDKVNQLDRELRSVTDTVGKGRGGSILGAPNAGPTAPRTTGPTSETREIPQAAIAALKADPSLKDQFEAKYGKGTAGVLSR